MATGEGTELIEKLKMAASIEEIEKIVPRKKKPDK